MIVLSQQMISILAPLAGSDLFPMLEHLLNKISIHAPLAGSDGKSTACFHIVEISILAPLAGSDIGSLPNSAAAT